MFMLAAMQPADGRTGAVFAVVLTRGFLTCAGVVYVWTLIRSWSAVP